TDSSRAKSLELHIQVRVAEELERLRQREKQTLEEIEKRVAAELPDRKVSGLTAPSLSTSFAAPAGSLDLDAPRIPFAGREFDAPLFLIDPATISPPQAPSQHTPAVVDPSREAVLKDIERLRAKLESRKKLSALDENVERAKTEVVNCLRLNDRRPLDCWKEVDSFKREVAKLERAFVDKVVG
ncbi:hypothetical protein F66182_17193, partial [Fusarium sp. NRRL 66182]